MMKPLISWGRLDIVLAYYLPLLGLEILLPGKKRLL